MRRDEVKRIREIAQDYLDEVDKSMFRDSEELSKKSICLDEVYKRLLSPRLLVELCDAHLSREEVAQLRSKLEETREALRPFARLTKYEHQPDDVWLFVGPHSYDLNRYVILGDVRRARKLVDGDEGERKAEGAIASRVYERVKRHRLGEVTFPDFVYDYKDKLLNEHQNAGPAPAHWSKGCLERLAAFCLDALEQYERQGGVHVEEEED